MSLLKVIVLLSDGEDTDTSYDDSENPIALLSDFKSQGGIVIPVGVRAHDFGYALMSTFATGGFFLNALPSTAAEVLAYLNGLKGYLCAGNCTPAGDTFQASGSLNYCGFANWHLSEGHVDLLGNGFLDLIPGNGLYVDLAGSSAVHKGRMESRDSFAIVSTKSYRLKLTLAGNNRVNAVPNSVRARVFTRNTDGIPDQVLSGSAVLSDGAGAAEVETYEYAFSYLNANGETALTPTTTLSNGGFDTFNIALTPDTAIGGTPSLVRFWKRELGTDKWYLIAEGADGSEFTDTYNNVRLGIAIADGTVDPCNEPVEANTTGTKIDLLNQVISINAFQQGFSENNLTFTPGYDMDVWVSIQQVDTPSGYDAIGLLLDRVVFEDADGDVLLEDNFDTENVVYIPPRCGVGSNYLVPGSGSTLLALGPTLTSDATTGPGNDVDSGTAITSSADWWVAFDGSVENAWIGEIVLGVIPGSEWIRYKFPEAKTVTQYTIAPQIAEPTQCAPAAWNLEGSNNESDWTEIDSQANILGWSNGAAKTFNVATPGSYLYYRFPFLAPSDAAASTFGVADIQFWSGSAATGGYVVGYDCDGDGCLTEPPTVQSPDPNPLPVLEGGWNPPQEFITTKEVCVTCDTGYVNLGDNLVPELTSNTMPSGTASSSDVTYAATFPAWKAFDGDSSTKWAADTTAFPVWLRYQFASAKTVRAYGVQASNRAELTPTDFSLQASDDGLTWTTLHTVTNATWSALQMRRYLIPTPSRNPPSYAYYRLHITGADNNGAELLTWVASFELYEKPTKTCATASGTGSSPALAEQAAIQAATQLAQARLRCYRLWSKTVSVTLPCDECGPGVVRGATAVSLNSEQEAEAEATAVATADANAALDCEQSVNDQPVQFNNGTLAKATPYPSYKFVEGETGVITNLTVTLTNLRHLAPGALVLVLEAPDGTAVMLLNHDGNGLRFFEGVDIVFDDAGATVLPINSGSGAIPAGTYKPTIEASGETLQLPETAPTQPYGIVLAAFDGVEPNGCWKLWACHGDFYTAFNPADAKLIGGWELTITT